MKTIVRLMLTIVMVGAGITSANAFVLTFDDIPNGSDLGYYSSQHGVVFYYGFGISDHNELPWIPSQAGNVLIYNSTSQFAARIVFGNTGADLGGNIPPYGLKTIGGFFSTDEGIKIRMTAYHGSTTDNPVGSIIIGDTDISLSNRYAEITSEAGDIDFVEFEGIGSPDTRLGFCINDMNIVPVPEPSAVAVLVSGLASFMLFWKQRAGCRQQI